MSFFSNLLNTQIKIEPKIYHKSENQEKGKFEKLAEILMSLENWNNKPTSIPSHRDTIVNSFLDYYNQQELKTKTSICRIFDCVKNGVQFQPNTQEESNIFNFFCVANKNRNSSRFFIQSETETIRKIRLWMPTAANSTTSSSSFQKNASGESDGKNEKIISEMQKLHCKLSSQENSNYMTAVKQALFAEKSDSEYVYNIIKAISNTQPHSLKTDLEHQNLLYLSLNLIHNILHVNPDLKGEKYRELNSFKNKLETILKNNPNSELANRIRQEQFELTKKVLDIKCKIKNIEGHDGKITTRRLSSKTIFGLIKPSEAEPKTYTLSNQEKLEYAKKLKLVTTATANGGLPAIEKPSEEFDKVLRASEAEAKSLFLTANPTLIEGADFKRSRDQRFAVSVSDARYKGSKNVNNGALVNHYDQIEENGKTSRFRCGAVHTQNAARQYVVKMLFENKDQISQDNNTINLIDTRYLDILLPGKVFGDGKRFEKHKQAIQNALSELKDENGKINRNKLQSMIFNLAEQNLLVERVNKEFKSNQNIFSLEDLEKLDGKQVNFFPLDLGPSSKNGAGHMVHTFEDKDTVPNLNELKSIFETKLGNPTDPEIKNLLQDLNFILTKNTEGIRPPEFVAGYKAFQLDEIIGRLSHACGMVSSAGCKSNKDRGSNGYMLHCIVNAVFAYRHTITGERDFSLKDFQLKDDTEKQLARNVIAANEVFMITLMNTGYGGSKCDRLNWLIEQAFGSKEELKAYEKLQEGSKFAKH